MTELCPPVNSLEYLGKVILFYLDSEQVHVFREAGRELFSCLLEGTDELALNVCNLISEVFNTVPKYNGVSDLSSQKSLSEFLAWTYLVRAVGFFPVIQNEPPLLSPLTL